MLTAAISAQYVANCGGDSNATQMRDLQRECRWPGRSADQGRFGPVAVLGEGWEGGLMF